MMLGTTSCHSDLCLSSRAKPMFSIRHACRVSGSRRTHALQSHVVCAHCNQPSVLEQTDLPTNSMSFPARRQVVQTLLGLFPLTSQLSACAEEGEGPVQRGYARYIKKKKLDPLETYVPSVLQARLQLETAGRVMKQDVEGARTLLRKGAFSGLRDCVKALGEYATQATVPQTEAAKLVSDFLNSLTSFDVVLARAARDKKPVPEAADRELAQALENMDRLLATVPAAELNKAQELLDKVQAALAEPSSPSDPSSDKAAQKLEQLVPSR